MLFLPFALLNQGLFLCCLDQGVSIFIRDQSALKGLFIFFFFFLSVGTPFKILSPLSLKDNQCHNS